MLLQSPLVSIVVPCYEQGSYLKECLESILSQQGVRIEVFVFDSESSDETPKVLKEFENLAKIVVERDLGQAHAINKGLRRCSGDIIGFLNSDDALVPESLQKVVNYFEMNPSTDLLYGKAKYIDSESNVIGDYRTQEWNWERFQGECFICQPAAFWSRRIMKRIGLLDQRLNCSLDYDYWLRLAQAGGVVKHIKHYLACSRDYPETKTRSMRSRVFIENFQLSLRRLGYIHKSWISQYMDFYKYEKCSAWSIIIPAPGKMRDWMTQTLQNLSSVWARDVTFRYKPYHRIL